MPVTQLTERWAFFSTCPPVSEHHFFITTSSYASTGNLFTVTWIQQFVFIVGDMCVVWRLFVVFQRNIWICIFPLVTLTGTFVISIVASYYTHQALYIEGQSSIGGSTSASFKDTKMVPWIVAAAIFTMLYVPWKSCGEMSRISDMKSYRTTLYSTSMIVFRIWRDDHTLRSRGITRFGPNYVMRAMRIIVESAALYTYVRSQAYRTHC